MRSKSTAAIRAQSGGDPWWIHLLRLGALAGLVASVPVILGIPVGRRLFWTVAIAAIPLLFTAGGFYLWRRICPLALFGQAGRFVGRPGKRKVGEWLARNYLYVQFGLLVAALALRLVATNGTAWALAGFLGIVLLAAVGVSFVYTGKTWCNYLCPVGIVEKFYNEPVHLARQDNSQCASCTACKKNCPDIDVELGYWKEADSPARRATYFAWPGVVLGFYTYFWLVAGDWDYYFGGAWTREEGQVHGILGPGLHFATWVPRVVAAPLTLLLFAGGSWAVFAVGESLVARGKAAEEQARIRHHALALAGFTAFVLFYCFAGQPTLRRLPDWVRVGVNIGVLVTATAMLLRRWGRREDNYVQEKFARGILRRWEWGDAPPSDNLADIYLIHTERTKQREARLRAYKETIRDMIADGVVSQNELTLLDKLRVQLGIGDKEHEKVLGELSAEDRRLFDRDYQGSIELRLQRQQYRRDLERIVMVAAADGRAPSREALETLRRQHDVPPEEHAEALAALRDQDGPITAQVREETAAVAELRRAARRARAAERPRYMAAGADAHSMTLGFFAHLCAWREAQRVERIEALRALVQAGEAPQSVEDPPADEAADAAALLAALRDASPYLRAAAAFVASRFDDAEARAAVVAAVEDPHPLVRETAVRALGARGRLTRDIVSKAMSDGDQRVSRAVVRAVLPTAAALGGAVAPEALAQTTHGVGSPDPMQFATLDPRAALETLSTFEKMMLLRQVPLFAALDPDDLEELSGLALERRYAEGKHLCAEGEQSDEVFLIVAGRVRAWVKAPDGTERTLGESGDGSCIGEMAALDQAPRTATVTALRDTRTLVLAGREFKALLQQRPAIAGGIIGVLTQRLRDMIAQKGTRA